MRTGYLMQRLLDHAIRQRWDAECPIGVEKGSRPPSEPCMRFSRTRLSSRWFLIEIGSPAVGLRPW